MITIISLEDGVFDLSFSSNFFFNSFFKSYMQNKILTQVIKITQYMRINI